MKKLLLSLFVLLSALGVNAQFMTLTNHSAECDMTVEIFRDYPFGMPSSPVRSGTFVIPPSTTWVISATSVTPPLTWTTVTPPPTRRAWDPIMLFSHVNINVSCSPGSITTIGGPNNGQFTAAAMGLPTNGPVINSTPCGSCNTHGFTATWTDQPPGMGVNVDIF